MTGPQGAVQIKYHRTIDVNNLKEHKGFLKIETTRMDQPIIKIMKVKKLWKVSHNVTICFSFNYLKSV